jgi:hypothetical protein
MMAIRLSPTSQSIGTDIYRRIPSEQQQILDSFGLVEASD